MSERKLKRPSDPFALAKLVGDIATGQVVDKQEDGKDDAAVARGAKGGKVGGKARNDALTPDRRSEIAKAAAAKRWKPA